MSPTTASHWKTDSSDLRDRAREVSDAGSDHVTLSPRAAARCLSGVIGLVVTRFGLEEMQRSCAELVRCAAAWDTQFGTLPRGVDGLISEPISLIAVIARGILPLAGDRNMRAALSFWAIEADPAVWQRVAAGAS